VLKPFFFAFMAWWSQWWGSPALGELGVPLAWYDAKIFDWPTQTDAVVNEIIQDYLTRLTRLGYDRRHQGIWLQTEWAYLAQNQAQIAAPAASLTKVATTLAVVDRWGLEHRFETRVYGLGSVENGVLLGDLIIEGNYDPLLVWEEAIALGNALHQGGIREVKGNLIIVGPLSFNFASEPRVVGSLLQEAFNSSQWSATVEKQYQTLPAGTGRPQILLRGEVKSQEALPLGAQLWVRHQSATVAQLVKQMNIYSNNEMAEILSQSVGGAAGVSAAVSRLANVPLAEIQLENGSGLGVNNRLSPRAVTFIYQALEQKIKPQGLTLGDLFPVMGRDREGTLAWRNLPQGVAVKTGTLNQVSALAGIIPTQERGTVWFTIINGGPNFDRLRAEQDKMLQRLADHWQILPSELEPGPQDTVLLGEPHRNQLLFHPS